MNGKWTFEITTENINSFMQKNGKNNIIFVFWAAEAEGCEQYLKTITNIVNQYAGKLLCGLINVEEEQQLAAYLQITNIPEIKMFSKGKPAGELPGLASEAQIRAFIGKYAGMPKAEDDGLKSINDKIAEFDLDGIEEQVLKMLTNDKHNEKLEILLVKYYLLTGQTAKAEERGQNIVSSDGKFLIDGLDFWKNFESLEKTDFKKFKPETYDDKLLNALFTVVKKQDFSGALEILVELVKENKNYNNQIARKAMVSIFTILGQGTVVEKFRNKLYNLIF